jgi:curved DNA-binding protein CbpA
MSSQKNYYKVLQVDPLAEPEVITAAYKRLSIKYHPDSNPARGATERMQEINEAYQVLKDPAKRRQYDLSRDRYGAWDSRPPPGPEPPPARPRENSDDTTIKPTPARTLANMIVSLTFPITYSLSVFILFRVFRPVNIVVIAAVLIAAGVIAYYATVRMESALRGGKR